MQTTMETMDLKDSQRDEERLQGDNAVMDMPSVKDIPGQEHIRPMPPGEMADTTISSADEEGEGLLDNLDEEDDEEDDEDELDMDEELTIGEDEIVLDDEEAMDEEVTLDDEEAMDEEVILDDEEAIDEEDEDDDDSDVTAVERNMLHNAATVSPGEEESNLNEASLDDTDDDGEMLNEGGSGKEKSGADLDVPGSELDDANEEIGEEDEENNVYSTAQR